MAKVISCGFVIRTKNGKYLIGKATGHQEPRCWTIFKGRQNPGETYLQTAIRELKEETGIDINADERLKELIVSEDPFFHFSLKKKDVYVFFLDDKNGILQNKKMTCLSFWGENDKPEIEDFRWVTLSEMQDLVLSSQTSLVEHLKMIK